MNFLKMIFLLKNYVLYLYIIVIYENLKQSMINIKGKSRSIDPFTRSKNAKPIDVDAPSSGPSGPPALGLGHALDPLQMLGKQCCKCQVGDLLDLEYEGSMYVAKVTKFEMNKSTRSSAGASSSRDGELLIYIKVCKLLLSTCVSLIY